MSYQEPVIEYVLIVSRIFLSPALPVILSAFTLTACSGPILFGASSSPQSKVKPAVSVLVKAEPEKFQSSYTLVVLLDSKACAPNLRETEWWSDWNRHMIHKGMGFVLVTSNRDSADVAIAARMDDVDAPVLVLPDCGDYVSDLWAPNQSIPLKLLLDSGSRVKGFWLNSVVSEEASAAFLTQVDSLIGGD